MNNQSQELIVVDDVTALCLEYGVDPWHAQNSLRRPIYQSITCEIVRHVAKQKDKIVEIGCGIGDLMLRLAALGFKNLHGLERDIAVFHVAAHRGKQHKYGFINFQNTAYPVILPFRPNVLLLINCMYFDKLKSKFEFRNELREWMAFNGEPDSFLVETVNSTYKSLVHTRLPRQPTEFNPHCRVSDEDMKSFFPEYNLYRCPSSEASRIPKTLYLITPKESKVCLDGLMDAV